MRAGAFSLPLSSTSYASPRSLQASGQSGGAASQPRDKAICVGRALSAVGQQSKCEVQVCACCYHLPGISTVRNIWTNWTGVGERVMYTWILSTPPPVKQ